MSPKWGIWFWIWGISTSNEYGSKKSVENTLKKVAIFSIIVFTLTAVIYPYLNKEELSTGFEKNTSSENKNIDISNISTTGIDLTWAVKNIKIEWINTQTMTGSN